MTAQAEYNRPASGKLATRQVATSGLTPASNSQALPHVGAQRIYIEDSNWQDYVENLVRKARLVVFRTGATKGLKWELRAALTTVKPEQILVVVDDKNELTEFLEQLTTIHPNVKTTVSVSKRSNGGILAFANPGHQTEKSAAARLEDTLGTRAKPRSFYDGSQVAINTTLAPTVSLF